MNITFPRPLIAAYYYPGWSRSTLRTIRGRPGGSEWDLLFDEVGALEYPDVRRPRGGPLEPSTESLEQECRSAMAGGIDAFIWCWYWDRSQLLFNETLDMFLECSIPDEFGYALMWVNKRPHYFLPLTSPSSSVSLDRMITTDEEDFRLMIEHLADRHWARPQYLITNNRPILLLFHVEFLVDHLGAERLRSLLSLGDEIARSAGFDGIEYVAIAHRPRRRWRHVDDRGVARWIDSVPLRRVGFRAISNYVYLPDWTGPAVQEYALLIERRAAEWPFLARLHQLPLWPSVSVGWDGRPRAEPRQDQPGYPWTPRVIGETPERFSRALRRWQQFSDRYGRVPLLPITSWNEWTEGHAVAPCDRHGDGMLTALRNFKISLETGFDRSSVAL